MPVIKSNGSLRLTVDYRKLNEGCFRQNWSIPNIEETLASLSGNKIFSTLDCANAFNALPIEEQSKPLTSITTKWGNYQFNKIPYGMQGSSFSFAKAIAKILSRLPRTTAYPYIDDAILATKTFDEMLNNLESVLEAYNKNNLIIQSSKSNIFAKSVAFLGHEICEKGIAPVSSYITAITRPPPPMTAKEGKSMLGKFAYQKKFIENYSTIVQPLREWTIEAERNPAKVPPMTRAIVEAINILKKKLTSSPILSFPQWNSPHKFTVYTDWSNKAVGVKITQVQLDRESNKLMEKTLLYDSKLLNETQSRYCSNKGELYAILWCYTLMMNDRCSFFRQEWGTKVSIRRNIQEINQNTSSISQHDKNSHIYDNYHFDNSSHNIMSQQKRMGIH